METKSTLDFFLQSGKQALDKFSRQEKTTKDKTPIAVATTIDDFSMVTDLNISRSEINQRNPKRDFIEIDWDIDDKAKLEKVIKKTEEFVEEYNTIVFYYPSFSYPEKERGRTIFFTNEPIGERNYYQAVKFLLNYIGVDNQDDQSLHIKSTFNLPVINCREQKDAMRTITPKGKSLNDISFLSPTIWSNVKVPRNVARPTVVRDYEITRGEQRPRVDEYVEGVAPLIAERFITRKEHNQQFDLERYYSFFQFLHSLARAEVVGSISRKAVEIILVAVAEGNPNWERQNIIDYKREFDRVANDSSKLLKARPLYYYIGEYW